MNEVNDEAWLDDKPDFRRLSEIIDNSKKQITDDSNFWLLKINFANAYKYNTRMEYKSVPAETRRKISETSHKT
ncbi:hypothetical protein PSSHI_09250 [Photobacterium sp. R1]